MRRILTVMLVALSLGTMAGPAAAQGFSYRYGQVTYDLPDFDGADGDGFGFAGSFEVTPDIFVQGALRFWDLDAGPDVDGWEIGGGYRRALNAKTDLYGTFSIGNYDFGTISASILGFTVGIGLDQDFWALRGGVRHRLQNNMEVGGTVGFVNYDPGDTEFEIGINGQYYFNSNLAGYAALSFSDPLDLISLGVRYYF